MGTILVAGDRNEQATRELIAAARSVSGDDGTLAVAFAGTPGVAVPDIGCDALYLVEHERLGESDAATCDAATDAFAALARQVQPDLVLFTRSDEASVIAPRVAVRLNASFARDCTDIANDGGSLVVTRPVHGGNANARYRLAATGTHIVMLRPGVFEPATAAGPHPEPVRFDPAPHIRDSRSTLIRTVQEAREGVRLEDADVVVSGGRGLGGGEPFKQLGELAEMLGGAVGASRAACDAGWIDHSHQVGLTGKSISPRLYITFGISGASQHMAGCSSARNIVAINTDPDASIFNDARFGVVGDWGKVLPGLISALRDLG